DKWRLLVQDRQSGKTRDVTEKFDRSVGSFAWAVFQRRPESTDTIDGIFFAAEDHGEAPIYKLDLVADAAQLIKATGRHNDDLVFSATTKTLFFTRMSL